MPQPHLTFHRPGATIATGRGGRSGTRVCHMMTTQTRRVLIGGTCALLFSLAAGTATAQKTLYVAAYGGSFEQVMRKEVFPPFEKQHGVRIEYVAGNSTDNLAKMQAQK